MAQVAPQSSLLGIKLALDNTLTSLFIMELTPFLHSKFSNLQNSNPVKKEILGQASTSLMTKIKLQPLEKIAPDKDGSLDLPSLSVESSVLKSIVEKANTEDGKESATLSLSTVYKEDKAPWN
jgi:hypothetical protein